MFSRDLGGDACIFPLTDHLMLETKFRRTDGRLYLTFNVSVYVGKQNLGGHLYLPFNVSVYVGKLNVGSSVTSFGFENCSFGDFGWF
jgi:hypothetical protein